MPNAVRYGLLLLENGYLNGNFSNCLGGNALLKRGAVLSAENQYQSIALIADAIGKLAKKYRIAIVHGNGPQVGLLALQNLSYRDVPLIRSTFWWQKARA